MSQGVSFSGLGSGIDTDSIIQQLMDIERRPILNIQKRQVRLEEQKGVVESINSTLLSLKASVEKLEKDDLFTIVNAKSEDAERVGVTATNEAAAGSFSIEVVALAQARRLSSRSFGDLSDELNLSGEFVLNGKGIEIAEEDSLLDIREAINNADAGVSAQLLTVAPNDSRLILTADEVGEDGFDIKDASSTNLLQALGFTASDTSVKNSFVNGGRSAQFLAADQSVGSLLNLASPPAGTVTVGDQEIAIDLTTDTLDDIRDKITAAAPTGVTAQVASSNDGGLTRYRLEVEGTSNFVDDSGILETLGVLDSSSGIATEIVSGAESDRFKSTATAVGSLLGLGSAPTGSVTIGGEVIDINLGTDSLNEIQSKINSAAPAGVNATIITSADDEGNSQFRLRIDGSTDFADSSNVLETLGVVVGSNNAFESVAQVLTANVGNQEKGILLHDLGNGAKSDSFADADMAVGSLIGSAASGTITIGDKAVSIDLAIDSLNAIADKINAIAPSNVSASVVGSTSFELQIDGTTEFVDDGGLLAALGIAEAPTTLTADTRFINIQGGGSQAGDTITITGTNHDGDQVSGSFTISSTNLKIENLLNSIEQTFGNEVTAAVDASGRIMLTDEQAGSSALTLSLQANNEGDGSLDFGALTVTTSGVAARTAELQAGQNAQFRINGITLSRSSNTVTDAVQGITLDLHEAEEGKLTNITVIKDDTTTLRQNIESFVSDYNSAMDLLNEQFVVDENGQGRGSLSGGVTLIGLQSQLRSAVSGQIDGLNSDFNALVLVGISFNRTGQLTIDNERLTAALTDNLDDVRKLFVAQGAASDEGVEYISSNTKTKAGDYAVEINEAATKAQLIGSVEFTGALDEEQTLVLTDKATKKSSRIKLETGATLDEIVAKINSELASDVAEVRRASIANTTDGTAAITADTTFSQIFGPDVQNGDTIRINGTTHDGNSVSSTFALSDTTTDTVGDLLTKIRSTFNGNVTASVDAEGRIVVADNQVGNSELTVTLIEENEGGGGLNFGSIDVEVEGRLSLEITASNVDNKLVLEHGAYGNRNGFTIDETLDSLGLASGVVEGGDVQGTINGEETDGFGRILSGKIGSEKIEGLSLRVGLSPESLALEGGERGNVNLIFGVARQLGDSLNSITDSFDGSLVKREQAINDTIDDLDRQIVDMERRIELKRLNLVNKFAALEGSIATMQSQGNFLTQQLAGLSSQE